MFTNSYYVFWWFKRKKTILKNKLNELITYLIPQEMSFFNRTVWYGCNDNIILEFFNGNLIKRMLSGNFYTHYINRRITDGSIINREVNMSIRHVFGYPFPIKYYTDKKYINLRYKYFIENRFNFFYTIDLITDSDTKNRFTSLDNKKLKDFENFLLENNFNLENFLYIDVQNNINKFNGLKIPFILLENRKNYTKSYTRLKEDPFLGCPCTMCTMLKNEHNIDYILTQCKRIKNNLWYFQLQLIHTIEQNIFYELLILF